MFLLLVYLLLFQNSNQMDVSNKAVDELHTHFSVEKESILNLGRILDQMKRISYADQLVKQGFHDVDNKVLDLTTKQRESVSLYLFEGDIFLSENQASSILAHLENNRTVRSLSSDEEYLWSEFPINCLIILIHLEPFTIRLIVESIEYWQSNTCIDFLQVDEPIGDYVQFFKGQGCFSAIGHLGGKQSISIGAGCERVGIIEHEIGHMLGLWHQQSRPDANNYIKVEKDFILPIYTSDFELRTTDQVKTLNIPYDFGSALHYGSTAFSIDGKSFTLQTRDPRYQKTIGQRERLSFLDIAIINKAYCSDACQDVNKPVSCSNGGFPHPRDCSFCICPDGYAGNQCKQNQESKNAECGGMLKATKSWQYIESPGYTEGAYEEDQKCSWLIEAPGNKRIQIKFIGDFGFLCTTSCVDYVELKLNKDQRQTGPRFCCHKRPQDSFISESHSMVVIFRTQYSEELGFKLKFRETSLPFVPQIERTETSPTPKIVKNEPNVWSEWEEWTKCTKDCGACGIKSRVRTCLSKSCLGRNQEFSTCNQQPCLPSKSCNKTRFMNRLCKSSSTICTQMSEKLAECEKPSCCPPFSLSADNRCSNSEKITFGR